MALQPLLLPILFEIQLHEKLDEISSMLFSMVARIEIVSFGERNELRRAVWDKILRVAIVEG